ncbi:hypothetical protein AB0D04_30460 [Streptomyces sp. NPDC048483]|uniref:hypothetical protein n=1 Tax=Streptomyces sp. NPDC048483 TaxID=3154927 RepID=UPI003423F197
MEETAESVAFGVGRFLAGRDMDGVKRTGATFWRSGTRVLPKAEGRVVRSSYRAGWKRLTVRMSFLGAATEGACLGGRHPGTTVRTVQALWEDQGAMLRALHTGGIGAVSVAGAGGLAYGILGRGRRELMREWVGPLHQALAVPLGIAEQTASRRYLHVPKNFSDDDAQIRVDLPVHLRFSRDLVADLITQELAWRA